ncbi:hypothetical protein P8452_22409 [Trifolium repens]|jgi:hypothetical protein|nr:hypothetical protein P8452_22409 [Trifolium repens]
MVKPMKGFYKVNGDANLSIKGTWGFGAMIQDEYSNMMMVVTWKVNDFDDATTTKVMPMKKAMIFAS